MSESLTFRCDECGKLKEESDHWYKAQILPGLRFVVTIWEQTLPDPTAKKLHLCGMECAVKAMAKGMEGK